MKPRMAIPKFDLGSMTSKAELSTLCCAEIKKGSQSRKYFSKNQGQISGPRTYYLYRLEQMLQILLLFVNFRY